MLIEFRVANYRSVEEEQVVSMVPAPKQKDHIKNILAEGKYTALNAVSIYGANGSGKSNILKAMSLLDSLVAHSGKMSSTATLPYDPFLLRAGWEEKPTKLEVTFVVKENRYRYGVEFNAQEIQSEWLYRKGKSREVVLFERKDQIIEVGPGFETSKLIIDAAIEATRENALFLSMCDILNIGEAKVIIKWFSHFNMIDGLNVEMEGIQTATLWQDPDYREAIKEYLTSLGLGISDIEVVALDFDETDLPSNLPLNLRSELVRSLTMKKGYRVLAQHEKYDKAGKAVIGVQTWDWKEKESSGAQKAFHLSGPLLYALKNGGVLIIDEMEAKIHPVLTLQTIDLFLNSETNPNRAQLIFATHDTNLLTYSTLRRDQICFAEKNNWGGTELFSLSDFIYYPNQHDEEGGFFSQSGENEKKSQFGKANQTDYPAGRLSYVAEEGPVSYVSEDLQFSYRNYGEQDFDQVVNKNADRDANKEGGQSGDEDADRDANKVGGLKREGGAEKVGNEIAQLDEKEDDHNFGNEDVNRVLDQNAKRGGEQTVGNVRNLGGTNSESGVNSKVKMGEMRYMDDGRSKGKTGNVGEKERHDTDKEKRYFEGRYGAIPKLENLKYFFRDR